MKIFIIGSPGCGKNTIAQNLAFELKKTHVNYRTIALESGTSKKGKKSGIEKLRLGNKPFPANAAFKILREYLEERDVNEFVLDGYPKTELEAEKISEFYKKDNPEENLTFIIHTPEKITVNRLSQRLVCPRCSYLLYDNPESIVEIRCANCHIPLIKRTDDNDDGIRYRTKRFNDNKEGIIKNLKKISRIYNIDGSLGLAHVISEITEKIFGKNSKTLAERGARILIEQLGLNLADPNIIGTPQRLVKVLNELMRGQTIDSKEKIRKDLNTSFPTHYKGMIILDPIKCISLCSHHLLPVHYEVIFGYIPSDKSLGFSKIVKVINLIAAKPALQEDFTQEVIETFEKELRPKGMMLIVKGKHSCMSIRGEKTENTNITSALRGDFKNEEKTREEFLSLIKLQN